MNHVMAGFGFGPIQAGLFVKEASDTGNFERIVVSEIDPELVQAIRANGNCYALNIAHPSGIETLEIENIELVDPSIAEDRKILVNSLAAATEIVTSLPSVMYYSVGEHSVASLIAESLESRKDQPALIYTAENNNRAAETLQEVVGARTELEGSPIQFVNTVIGKMSRCVTDASEIRDLDLAVLAPGLNRAYLVEEFNHILVERCNLPGFNPGIGVFEEKEDLLPFQEAKLYGHNAVHALIGFLGLEKGYKMISEVADDEQLSATAREAFLHESGVGLLHRHGGKDPLFTEAGFRLYAEDLLERMYSPYLRDNTERVTRDPIRKLGWNDRIIGTINLALEAGITPLRFVSAAKAAIALVQAQQPDRTAEHILQELWSPDAGDSKNVQQMMDMLLAS
ncbi:MAG: hypothetical protein QGH15_11520 [Kiritimatiellia bacterium]|jgi:mannitol-1-phosphate 5-dehydrogenase|nr:hypothetical protein [Kiritimatiellia bacterium]